MKILKDFETILNTIFNLFLNQLDIWRKTSKKDLIEIFLEKILYFDNILGLKSVPIISLPLKTETERFDVKVLKISYRILQQISIILCIP